jgi:hypothetical protein
MAGSAGSAGSRRRVLVNHRAVIDRALDPSCWLMAFWALLLMACSGPLPIKNIAKTDIDQIAEIHRQAAFGSLRILAEKLYRRNPREWQKNPDHKSMEDALSRLFTPDHHWNFVELGDRRGAEAIHLGLREDWQGDRVLAYIGGLGAMMDDAFDNKKEFFVLDTLNAQKLYNCARNIEIADWKLRQAKTSSGELLLLSNERGPIDNLSFARETGKMIAQFDLLAHIIADKTNRTVIKTVQTVGTYVFLPILGL